MTILLVEDHANTRRGIRVWLEMSGHSVLEASDMKSGLAAASQPFDLLVCDLGLPDGDGWTLLQTLRKERSVNGIAISGYCSPADIARSKAAGFLVHLPKPFTPGEFDAALASVTHGANTQRQRRTRKARSDAAATIAGPSQNVSGRLDDRAQESRKTKRRRPSRPSQS